MRRLTHRDVRALLAFLPELYAVRDLDAFARHVVGAMPKLIRCDISTYNEMNPRQRRIRWMSDPVEAEGAADRNAFERHMVEHPILAHYARTGDGRAVTVSDFVTQRQFHRLALYNEFYRPIDTEDMIAVHLGHRRSLAIAVALLRSSRNFTGDHHVLLNLLRPHLVQAYANAEAVTQLRQELRATGRALEAADHGIVVLTPAGRVRLMTVKARRWIAEYFGSPEDRLPDALRRWVRHREDGVTPRAPLVVERDGKRLVVRLVSDPDQRLLLLAEQRTAVRSAAGQAYGLSRREAEVLAWVVEGKTNPEIGAILGTSRRTVAKQLEGIFRKLRVETRTAAAALALTTLLI